MLVGLARSEIEVVEPLPIEFSQATPTIVSPSEAMQWLNAHHVHSPITRHALVVLESIDAVDLAFDTFVCALLDGEVDTSGYPEYNAIVGGVAAHWDEATGDMICRAVVGWGGKGVRGDTDRIGAKLLGGHPQQHPRQPVRARPDQHRATGPGRRPRRPRLRALRVRVGARAGVLLPEVRHAPAARLRPDSADARLRLRLRRLRPPVRGRSTASTPTRPTTCPLCGKGPIRKAISAAGGPLQGIGLGEEGAARDGDVGARPRPSADGASAERRRRLGGGRRPRVGAERRRRAETAAAKHDRASDRSRPTAGAASTTRLTAMAAPTDWITLAEAAEILAAANIHFTPATIGGWARAGRLQSIKLGGRRFVRRGEVRALVAAPRRVRAEDLQPVLFEDLGG